MANTHSISRSNDTVAERGVVSNVQFTKDMGTRRTWLTWVGERLMPELTKNIQDEEEETAKIEAERREAAKAIARQERERDRAREIWVQEKLLGRFVRGEIDAVAFKTAMAVLDAKNDGDAVNEGEQGVAGENDDMEAMGERRAAKRKRTETVGGLRDASGKCDRCAEAGERSPYACEYGMDDRKCNRCTKDRKGCFWGGISRDGKTKKTRATTEKRETRDTGNGIQRTASCVVSTCPMGAAGSSSARKTAKGKAAQRFRDEIEGELDIIETERRAAQFKATTYEYIAKQLGQRYEELAGELDDEEEDED